MTVSIFVTVFVYDEDEAGAVVDDFVGQFVDE